MHTLIENGTELEGIESYIRDDVERLGIKLSQTNERTKGYLADLLVSHIRYAEGCCLTI